MTARYIKTTSHCLASPHFKYRELASERLVNCNWRRSLRWFVLAGETMVNSVLFHHLNAAAGCQFYFFWTTSMILAIIIINEADFFISWHLYPPRGLFSHWVTAQNRRCTREEDKRNSGATYPWIRTHKKADDKRRSLDVPLSRNLSHLIIVWPIDFCML